MYRIAVVDDELLFRKGLSMMINQHDLMEVTISAENGQDLFSQLIMTDVGQLPHLILCDLEMPVLDGVDTTKKLNKLYPDLKIVILSSHYEAGLILKMIEIGASSFMPKNEKPNNLFETITNVIEKGFHYNDYVIKLIREKMLFGTKSPKTNLIHLTNREIEILELICNQKTNKEIGEDLFISSRTVEGHRNKLIEKTFSKNTAGLIIYAIENGYYNVNIKQEKWT